MSAELEAERKRHRRTQGRLLLLELKLAEIAEQVAEVEGVCVYCWLEVSPPKGVPNACGRGRCAS